jgi:moderate conductance mechanosensitive channel
MMDGISHYSVFGGLAVAWLKAHSAKIIIILLGAWALAIFSRTLIKRSLSFAKGQLRGDETAVAEREKRAQTIFSLLSHILNTVIITFAVLMVLAEIGMNTAALLAGAGILGVAVGFGAQSIVKDALSGLFLIIEDQFRLGDTIDLNGGAFVGKVEKMTLRTTWLRADDGRLIIVPNGGITSVTNHTHA